VDFREEDIDDERLRQLHRYWRRKRDERAMPRRADIDPLELRNLLGSLFLIDVGYEPLGFRYRLAGTRLVELFGRELTRVDVGEVVFQGTRPPLREQCSDVALNRRPSYIIMLIGNERRRLVYRQLLLPLSNDGKKVDILLGGAVFAPVALGEGARNALSAS
jgi:hypothetical protein